MADPVRFDSLTYKELEEDLKYGNTNKIPIHKIISKYLQKEELVANRYMVSA